MKHERNNLMKRSLEKWGRAPIILGVLEHPLFWGLEHPSSRRARAPTIQRGTSTHCSKTNKQRASEQLQSGYERNKFMKCSLEKMGARAPIILGARRAPIILGGLDEHRFLRGASTHHSESIQLENWWINTFEYERNEFMKMLSWKNGCAHPLFLGARAPIILGARAPIF